MLKPDYNRSILSISSSILKKYGIKGSYPSLQELDKFFEGNYRNVVYLVLDGLGTNILELYDKELKFLKEHLITNVTSVFPPTTAAATIAIHSGLSPFETGWIGWMPYFKEYDRMIELFTGCDFYTKEKIVESLEKGCLKYETIYEQIVKNNKDINFIKAFPDFANKTSNSFLKICEVIEKACSNKGRNLVSAYWTEPDSIIHKYGISSIEVKQALKCINNNLEKLMSKLKDTIIIITADHGAVDIEEIYLNEYKEIDDCLLRPPSIDSRFVSFFVKEDKKEIYKELITKCFKDNFLIYEKDEFLKLNLLGYGKKHERIDDYFGDFILIGNGNLNIRYTTTGIKSKSLKADHSGITKEEMQVPVIVIESKK